MFNQYEPNVKAAIAFLRLLKVKVNSRTVNETLQNHTDWPSLLCISDSLNKWNIPNGAGKIEPTQIDQLPTPFIAYTNDREAPLAIVSDVSDRAIKICKKNYDKLTTETKEDFLKNWNGIYLIAESSEHSGEAKYEVIKRKAIINSLLPFSAITIIVILSFLYLNKIIVSVDSSASFSTTGIYLQYLLMLAGVVITSFLLWYEIDKNNPVLQKVCAGIAKGNCNAILSGKQAKVFTWLSWSEVGFFYYAGGLLTLLFTENQVANTINAIAWLNIMALPYTMFSLYYQWNIAKNWCLLCLSVQALLMLGGINVLTHNFLFPLSNFSIYFIIQALLLYFLPVLIWKVAKPYVVKIQEAKNTKREYLRIKFNTDIYTTLLKKQKKISIPVEGLGIDIGNPNGKNTLIKVCNPYCGPCSKAHRKIEKLLELFPDLKVKIVFKIVNEEHSPSQKTVRHLLAAADSTTEESRKKVLNDWYIPDSKDYEEFSRKHPVNGELLKQSDKIEAMDKWCRTMEIRYTPTIFINGYQLPDAYGIEDLEYFLLE